MTKYIINEVSPSGAHYGYRLGGLKTLRAAAEHVLNYDTLFTTEVSRFDNEQDAIEAAKRMRWDATTSATMYGHELTVSWHEVNRVELDEDGDEIDGECLGAWNMPSVDDIVAMLEPEDDDDEED